MKFKVPFKGEYTVYIEVEADNKEEACELAWDETGVSAYCGNGGTGDKLIGVYGDNVTIEDCDYLEIITSDVEQI